MIIIKHVDFVELPASRVAELCVMPDYSLDIKTKDEDDFRLYYLTETIKPQNFINQRGETVRIGCSKQAQEVIGIIMDSFNYMNKENQRQHELNMLWTCKLRKIRNAGFFKRLVWLFTGITE